MNPFNNLWFNLGLAAAIIVLIGIAVERIHTHGYNAHKAEVAAQDRKAINNAETVRGSVRACLDVGGVWNAATGKCGG